MNPDLFNPPALVTEVESLGHLASLINGAHDAGEAATRKGLEHFRTAGEILLKAKEKCGHGKWMAWLTENVRFDSGTARRYMQIARAWDKVCAAHNLADALRLLTEDAPEAEPGSQETVNSSVSEQTAIAKQDTPTTVQPPDLVVVAATANAATDGTHAGGIQVSNEPLPATDAADEAIPEVALPAFKTASEIVAICREIDGLLLRIEEISKGPGGRLIRFDSLKQQIKDAKGNLWANRATHVCPYCHGVKGARPCVCCKDEGWTAKHIWTQAPGNYEKAKRQ